MLLLMLRMLSLRKIAIDVGFLKSLISPVPRQSDQGGRAW